jgi:acetate kinase
MNSARPCVAAINAGSSSIRWVVYEIGPTLERRAAGTIDRIGLKGTSWSLALSPGKPPERHLVALADHRAAATRLLDWMGAQPFFPAIKGIGHRVVHGMRRSEPQRITPALLAALHHLTSYDPEHLPREIGLIEAFRNAHPRLPQVACFDTSFHRNMPRVARLLPIPRRYATKGVERYGFHGLSYAFLMEELERLDPAASRGKVILAHLGNGASLAAVHDGKSVDTSMGFTPASGLVMGTRTGDLDPGLAYFLARTEKMTAKRFQTMVNHESGLLGISGRSSDMRDLLARGSGDPKAADAVDLFCYQARKWIGSFAAALGGLDTLVFAGGIGENAPVVRERICAGLGFLGVEVDLERNARNAPLVSTADGRVAVRVMHTDEESIVARSVVRLLNIGLDRKS